MAKILQGEAPGGRRQKLVDILPLDTPLLIQIFPIYRCNFRCVYCHFSIPKKDRGFVSNVLDMDFSLYEKCVKDAKEFPGRIKTWRFVGMGEPLLHKQIAEMVKLAKDCDIADRIEILTNGSLLTPDMGEKLINAGLDRLVVSIQGVEQKKYKEISGVNLNFTTFLQNLQYFYNSKTSTDVYIKIVDTALGSWPEDEERFYNLFGSMCDSMSIEHTSPIYPGVSLNRELGSRELTQFGLPVGSGGACSQSFYSMQINPDGNVVPCYSIVYPDIVGNVESQSLHDIWNGQKYKQFRMSMINNDKCDVCKECNINRYRLFPEDDISAHLDYLRTLYES